MKIISNTTRQLEELPKGKLNIRHRQMRNTYQVFAGRTLLDGCSGPTPEEAAEQLRFFYETPGPDAMVTVHHTGSEGPREMKLVDLREE